MDFIATAIAGAFEVRHQLRGDARGRFKRQFCAREFAGAGLNTRWVQVNHSMTTGRGAARGLHFQRPPHAEVKLVSCPVGKAFDVAVDLRAGSPTFLRWAAVGIDPETSFYIPQGCAHGFQALSDEVHLIYLHSAFYAPEAEGGVALDDPTLAIDWPLPLQNLSDRDRSFLPVAADFKGISL